MGEFRPQSRRTHARLLSDGERQEVFEAFAPDEDMRLFGRGIRRRLPPMLGGDQARIRLVYSLLFSLPGTPVLFYGEEIGMGENLAVDGRMSVRTPMQWTDGRNGGFSTARRSRLPRPVVEGAYGHSPVEDGELDDLLSEVASDHSWEGARLELKLDGYGYRWFRIRPADRQMAP